MRGSVSFFSTAARWQEFKDLRYTLQVAPEDCTGCALCVEVCPAKNKTETRLKAINMRPQASLREEESRNWDFFLQLPERDRQSLDLDSVKDSLLRATRLGCLQRRDKGTISPAFLSLPARP